MVPARPIVRFVPAPLVGPDVVAYAEPMDHEIVWHALTLFERSRDRARSCFSGSLAQRNRWSDVLRSYIRQAAAYSEPARHVRGSSSALLHYYSAMNLAKAELLVRNPASAFQKRLHHGLSHSPTRAKTLRGDELTVTDGVFRLLYEGRMGRSLPKGTRLPIVRVLMQIPEIAHELNDSGFGVHRPLPVLHCAAGDDRHNWSVLGLHDQAGVLRNRRDPTTRALVAHLEQIDMPAQWRSLFGLQTTMTQPLMFFQSRRPLPAPPDQLGSPSIDMHSLVRDIQTALHPWLDRAGQPWYDAAITPSLFASRELALPGSLARYAAMYYLSSVVRYRPEQLDPYSNGRVAWLLDTLANFSAVPLAADGLEGIIQKPVLFDRRLTRV